MVLPDAHAWWWEGVVGDEKRVGGSSNFCLTFVRVDTHLIFFLFLSFLLFHFNIILTVFFASLLIPLV